MFLLENDITGHLHHPDKSFYFNEMFKSIIWQKIGITVNLLNLIKDKENLH